MYAQISRAAVFHHSLVNMDHADRLIMKNANWLPVKQDAEGWQLRSEDDAQHHIFVGHQELFDGLSDRRATIQYNYNCPEQQKLRVIFGNKKFEDFPEDRRQLALMREALINRYDAEYPTAGRKRWNNAKLQAKLEVWYLEIQARTHPKLGRADKFSQITIFASPSVKTFWRDYVKYHDCDCDVLSLIQRHHGPGTHLRPMNADSIAFAHTEAQRFMTRLKLTKAEVYRDYVAKLAEYNTEKSEKLHKVSRYKLESIIDKFGEFEKAAARHGPQYATRKFSAVKRSFDVSIPGERIEIDCWNVELMSLFAETGMWSVLPDHYKAKIEGKRIWFVAAIDVATRYILAFKACVNPKAATTIAALRMIMSDKTHLSSYVGAKTPWIGRLRPRQIYSDNGSEFVSARTQEVMRNARISFTRPPAGQPQARPFIEGLFHSIGPLVARHFDGRTFGSIAEKGDYVPDDHISLDVDELVKVFLLAICDIYHNKEQAGLGRTPHNAWVDGVGKYPIDFPPCEEEMLHIFGDKYQRRISSYGITFMGIPYSNDELTRLRKQYGQIEFQIKVDPENLRSICVRDENGKWFVVENKIDLDDTVSLAEWVSARQMLRQQNASESESGLNAMYSAINHLRRIGEAATVRANLSPRTLDTEHISRLESELYGDWIATSNGEMPELMNDYSLPDDLFQLGQLSENPTLAEYHTDRKSKTKAKAKVSETALSASQENASENGSASSNYYYDDY